MSASIRFALAITAAATAPAQWNGSGAGDRWLEVSLRGLFPPSLPLAEFSAGAVGDCADGAAAAWVWTGSASSPGTLSPVGAPGLCLDVSLAAPAPEGGILSAPPNPGAPGQLRPCNASAAAQLWALPSDSAPGLVTSACSWQGAALCLSPLHDGSGGVGVLDCRDADAWAPSSPPLQLAVPGQPAACLAAGGRDLASQAAFILNRVAPLLAPTTGDVGLILDLGWLIDIVTEWTGDAAQPYPISTVMAPQWANATYATLEATVASLRRAAADAGLTPAGRFHVGVLMVGWSSIYQIPAGPFTRRHPEVYTAGGRDLDFAAAALAADAYPYAAFPRGVAAGADFFAFFGAQWAAAAGFLGADAVVVRDGLSTYSNYAPRGGPLGEAASPDPAMNAPWLVGQRAVFAALKRAAPRTLVIGYSSAASAVAETRIGLMDLEAAVGEGWLDAWIDQSWAGAWQDVPDRKATALGWTFQLQYILAHRAAIAGGNAARAAAGGGRPPCRHYSLTETFDSYEIWSTIRDVPGKLAWGIWAFNTAALVVPGGGPGGATDRLQAADGAYVSWAWSWQQGWLSPGNVSFLAAHIGGAQAAGAALEAVFGPTILYNRAALDRMAAEAPAGTVGEWVDEQAAMLAKFGVGAHSVARVDAAPTPFAAARADGYLVHTPMGLSVGAAAALAAAAAAGSPLLLLGRAAAMDEGALRLAGLARASQPDVQLPRGLYAAAFTAAARALLPPGLLPAGAVNVSLANASDAALLPGTVLLAGLQAPAPLPLLTLAPGGPRGDAPAVLWWQAGDRQAGAGADTSLAAVGSAAPAVAVAAALAGLHAARNVSRVDPASAGPTAPVSLALFRCCGGAVRLLAGNLESANTAGPPAVNASSASPRAPRLLLRLDHVGVPAAARVPGACWQLTDVVPVGAAAAPVHARADSFGDEVAFVVPLGPHGGRAMELGPCSAGAGA